MRIIRAVFLLVLAAVLLALALANREPVTLSLKLGSVLPEMGLTLPLFLVILLALTLGLVLGVVWEWLRSAGHRRESKQRAHEIELLKREVKGLRHNHAAPADDVLAILDAPRPTPGKGIAPAGPPITAKG